jgi:hypothetical protein
MPIAAFDKWETSGADRIYDAGELRIFDIWRIVDARP